MSNEHISFFDVGGMLLGLFATQQLAEDITISAEGSGFRRVTMAHNVASKPAVAQFLKLAESHGAEILKKAQDVFWGGHSGYFRCPDGHIWEVAWNPFLEFKDDGTLDLEKK